MYISLHSLKQLVIVFSILISFLACNSSPETTCDLYLADDKMSLEQYFQKVLNVSNPIDEVNSSRIKAASEDVSRCYRRVLIHGSPAKVSEVLRVYYHATSYNLKNRYGITGETLASLLQQRKKEYPQDEFNLFAINNLIDKHELATNSLAKIYLNHFAANDSSRLLFESNRLLPTEIKQIMFSENFLLQSLASEDDRVPVVVAAILCNSKKYLSFPDKAYNAVLSAGNSQIIRCFSSYLRDNNTLTPAKLKLLIEYGINTATPAKALAGLLSLNAQDPRFKFNLKIENEKLLRELAVEDDSAREYAVLLLSMDDNIESDTANVLVELLSSVSESAKNKILSALTAVSGKINISPICALHLGQNDSLQMASSLLAKRLNLDHPEEQKEIRECVEQALKLNNWSISMNSFQILAASSHLTDRKQLCSYLAMPQFKTLAANLITMSQRKDLPDNMRENFKRYDCSKKRAE